MANLRSVEIGNQTVMFGNMGWDVSRVALYDLVGENPDRVGELAEARVAYQTDAGERFITSVNGWRADFAAGRTANERIGKKGVQDPRIAQLGLAGVLHEFDTSVMMSKAPWLQQAIDLERVTGSTEQDFVFATGINTLQRGGTEGEMQIVAAVTDILCSNPQDEYGGCYRLTRDIKGIGLLASMFEFPTNNWGPNIRMDIDFGMSDKGLDDDWVVWSTSESSGSNSRLYPVSTITAIVEVALAGERPETIPTYALKQMELAR